MKTKSILFILLLLVTQVANAQITFERTYGGAASDQGTGVLQTSDGGYVITGGSFSFGNGSNDVYLIKTDIYGDTLWTKIYGGSAWDIGISVIQTHDGGYIISGQTSSFGNGLSDVYLIRTDNHGDTLWTKTYGGNQDEAGNSIIENSDGTFIIAGYTWSFASGFSAAYILKIDEYGNLIWQKSYEKYGQSSAADVLRNNSGYIVSGSAGIAQTAQEMFYLLKLTNNGDTIWTKTYSWQNGDIDGASIIITPDNGYVLSGSIRYPDGESDLCLMKTDTNGNVLWFKTFGGIGEQSGGKSCQTSDSGFVLTGVNDITNKAWLHSPKQNGIFFCDYINKLWTNPYLFLLKTSSDGDSIWSCNYGNNNSFGCNVKLANDNGFVVCGGLNNGTDQNVYMIKTNEEGHAGIMENNRDTEILIYPNPSSGILRIKSFDKNEDWTYRLYTINGKLIISGSINILTEQILDLSDCSNGLYLVKILGNYKNYTFKVTFQK